jgi:hypothetical protein
MKTISLGRGCSEPKLALLMDMAQEQAFTDRPNLTLHRTPSSVWDRSGWNGSRERPGVPRVLLGVGGGVLVVQGLRQHTWTGRMLAGLGGTLAWWALTGRGDLSGARRWFDEVLERTGSNPDDQIHEASADSFPASDAPSRTAAIGTGVRRHTLREH